MRQPLHSDRRARNNLSFSVWAFTLIEILVVVAIIALLIAVLMPSLAQSRANARATVCLSNIHQFGLAFLMYENENRDFVPRGGTQESQHWVMLVARQIGDKRHYLDVEQVPVEKYPIYSCPERTRTLPFPFMDYVVNTVTPDLKYRESRELLEPTSTSRWRYPSKILMLGDAAFEQGYTSWQTGGSTSPELRMSRENHERGKQWVPGTPFDPDTQGSLSRMDFFLPEHMPSQPTRRPGSITHMKSFTNWLYADNHAARMPWLNGARPCSQWLQMMGVLNPNLPCW